MNKKIAFTSILLISTTLCLLLYQVYITAASPRVPYMDTMLIFVQLDQILRGQISWFDAYGAGEHRGLIYPIVTLVEWVFWGADAKITTMLTGLVVAACFYLWVKVYVADIYDRGDHAKKNLLATLCVAGIAAVLISSPAAFELWTLSLGFPQLLKNLLIIFFLHELAINPSWKGNSVYAIFYGLWGGAIILLASYGWSYPFFIACIFVLLGVGLCSSCIKKNAVIVLLLLLFAQAIYIYLGMGVFSNNASVGNGFAITNIVKGMLFGAGTVFMGSESIIKLSIPNVIPMLLGALLLLLSGVALISSLLSQNVAKIFFGGLLVFGLMVLVGVTLARGAVVYTNTGSSRYYVDYIWLLLGSAGIFLAGKEAPFFKKWQYLLAAGKIIEPTFRSARWIMAVVFLVAFVGHVLTWLVEMKVAPYRAEHFKNMEHVYRDGVVSDADAALLQSPYSAAKRGVDVAQHYYLGPFRGAVSSCSMLGARFQGEWYPAEENGARWLKQKGSVEVDRCSEKITLNGYLPESFSPRQLSISYGNHHRLVELQPGQIFSIELKNIETKRTTFTLAVDITTSPSANGAGQDQRELGVLFTSLDE